MQRSLSNRVQHHILRRYASTSRGGDANDIDVKALRRKGLELDIGFGQCAFGQKAAIIDAHHKLGYVLVIDVNSNDLCAGFFTDLCCKRETYVTEANNADGR